MTERRGVYSMKKDNIKVCLDWIFRRSPDAFIYVKAILEYQGTFLGYF